ALWAVLQRITWARLIGGGLLMGALLATKFSAVLLLPIAIVMVAARLARRDPLRVELGAVGRARSTAFAAAVVLPLAIAAAVIWALYGFRYAASATASGGRFAQPWEYVLE